MPGFNPEDVFCQSGLSLGPHTGCQSWQHTTQLSPEGNKRWGIPRQILNGHSLGTKIRVSLDSVFHHKNGYVSFSHKEKEIDRSVY